MSIETLAVRLLISILLVLGFIATCLIVIGNHLDKRIDRIEKLLKDLEGKKKE